MFKRMTYLMLVVWVLGLACTGWGATKVIIVTNNPADEASYTPFLRNLLGNDITVEAEDDKYIDPLSAAAKADLNAADLIIVSRRTSSGKFVASIPFWNGLAAPVVLHSSFLIGDDRWRWMAGGTQNVDVTRVGVVDGNDLVFDGVPITGGQVEISSTVLAGVDVSNQSSVGNGTKIATPAGSDKVMIARWAAGIEYYPGSGHIAGGPRLFFGMRTDEFLPFINDNGKKMLGNAILSILGRLGPAPTASEPKPANTQTDVARDTVLSWTPGIADAKHDVYFGTVSQSVNDASRTNPLGVLVGQNLSGNEHDPVGLLEFGRTYSWRIDEVNAVNSSISKGEVWSFTVEPYVYPIQNILATASSAEAGMGPENTANGSGLNANDQHSTELKDMWLSTGVQPNWIQFAFDKIYKLHEMWVWNSNQVIEKVVGFGARSVTVEYSVDGSTWTPLAGIPEFARAPGVATYAHDTTISFGGVSAKYVKLSINSSWASVPQASLSEVRFFYVPVQAREPVPANGATDVDPDAVLSWRTGREAVTHELYFSSDRQAVADGVALAGKPNGASYTPSSLELGRTYYWKVVEVNEAASSGAWESDVWSFSTRPLSVIDDFEGYTNDSPNRVFQTWIDGMGFSPDAFFPNGNTGNGTGAMVGYDPTGGTIMETVIVHGGKQAMPVEYNNVNQPYYSEVERTWPTPQDWTANGADTLVLYMRGNPVRFSQTAPDAITMSAAGTDIWNTADEFRFASKHLNGNGTIIAKVNSVENTNAWVKAGVMIRESLAPGSRYAAVYATPGNGVHFQARTLTEGTATSDTAVSTAEQTALKTPVWIKLERSGSSFSGSYSTDGVKWTVMSWSPQTVNMAANVYVGLAISSHVAGVPATAEFSAISTTGSVTGTWEVTDIGVVHPGNDPCPMYVVVQDSAGKVKTVNHPNPAATTLGSWQEWRIAMSDFSGVNMAGVKKLSIGAGNRASPKAGGTGMLYIDDILVGHPAP